MIRRLIIASTILFMAAPVFAATTDPTHAITLLPGQIQWKMGEASDTAWPIGDDKKPGACLELIRWHPGHFSRPHYHSRRPPRGGITAASPWCANNRPGQACV